METENDGKECIEKQRPHSIRPLANTALIRQHTANQNGHTAGTQPIRESNGSVGQQPTPLDFACWIGAEAVHTAPEASNATKHTEQIVPDLVRVSPNTSDVQRLGQCASTFKAVLENNGRRTKYWHFGPSSDIFTFVASGSNINGCVLSYFEGTANLHCYTSCTLTTLHCIKESFLHCCPMKRYNQIFAEMWGLYSLLWVTVHYGEAHGDQRVIHSARCRVFFLLLLLFFFFFIFFFVFVKMCLFRD